MVAAKDYHQEQSTVLKYSCNEGYSWKDFTFSSVRKLHCIAIQGFCNLELDYGIKVSAAKNLLNCG